MAELFDLNKLRNTVEGKDGKEAVESFKQMKESQAASRALTADEFAALPEEEQSRIAEENDTNRTSYVKNLRLKEAMRGGNSQ